ncbi:dockerin type I repeat-containing protein [Patescibacteria group bacterium]|nr:dockerin type I repeat-containing protein [Patescibacteria group bacterium]
MFSTLSSRLLLGIYIFVILSIPVGAYLVSQSQTIKSSAQEQKTTKPVVKITPKPITSPSQQLLGLSQTTLDSMSTPTPSPSPTTSEVATSYGPTLSLSVTLEGRPQDNYATKLFVGIIEGLISTNPKYLLSFTIDLPASGQYSNLSLAGLNPGSTYTVLLKGSAQIATSFAFTMSPSVTNLNDGQSLNLLSGDLNEDNVINSADYSIAQKIAGTTPASPGWNENADLNKDGIINVFDLGLIAKNIDQIGASGAWTSPIPITDSLSVGSPEGAIGGYWLWIPK